MVHSPAKRSGREGVVIVWFGKYRIQ
jgi:hypothetical protein